MIRPRSWNVDINRSVINTSVPRTQGKCLVATGVRASIPNVWGVKVSDEYVRFNLGGSHINKDPNAIRFMYALPARVIDWARLFDDEENGGPDKIKPFKFQLDARTATYAPVMWRGERLTPYRKRKSSKRTENGRRCSVRRHAGLVSTGKKKTK